MKGLLVDDDELYARTLQRSLARKGIETEIALDAASALARAREYLPDFALVDLKLGSDSGLTLIEPLRALRADMQILLVTGYASVATAVESIKLGACHYLTKPSNTDDIEAAFARVSGDPGADIATRTTSIKTLEWEHIHRVLVETDFNISESARRLGMHRRTLARKLEKRPVR